MFLWFRELGLNWMRRRNSNSGQGYQIGFSVAEPFSRRCVPKPGMKILFMQDIFLCWDNQAMLGLDRYFFLFLLGVYSDSPQTQDSTFLPVPMAKLSIPEVRVPSTWVILFDRTTCFWPPWPPVVLCSVYDPGHLRDMIQQQQQAMKQYLALHAYRNWRISCGRESKKQKKKIKIKRLEASLHWSQLWATISARSPSLFFTFATPETKAWG